MARPQRVGVIRSEDALPVREQFAIQPQRLRAPPPRRSSTRCDGASTTFRGGRAPGALLIREQFAIQPPASARPPPRRSSRRCGGASPTCRGARAPARAADPGAIRGTAAAPSRVPRLAAPVGDVFARRQRVGVIRSEDAPPVREQFAVQPQLPPRPPPRRYSGRCVARHQRVGVIRSEARCRSGSSSRYSRSASRASPASPIQRAIPWRVSSVSGWSGPWTRCRSGSNSRYSRSASRASPASPVQWAMPWCVVSVSG